MPKTANGENRGRSGHGVPTTDPKRWVEEHGDYLFGYAMLRLGDRDQAEEAVQDALVAALDARERFSGRSSERTWLTAILKHKVIDRIGRLSRERDTVAQAGDNEYVSGRFNDRGHWQREPGRWPGDPEKQLERKELHDVLRRCISRLPERHRQAFVLRQVDGLSTEEICKALDVSRTNLWVMLHRARLRLRDCLEENWFGRPRRR